MTTKYQCDETIREYREHSRTEWLLVAWAIAGGSIGSAIIILSANVELISVLLGD